MAEPGYLIFSSRIREIYSSLTRKERTIADYMLDHPEQIPNATAGEIGAATASSAATVVRFCRSCGFNGLPELKLALSRADREPELRPEHGAHPRDKADLIRRRVLGYHNTVINAMLLDWDFDAYDAAADAILKARRVLLLGEGGSRSSCLNLFYTLLSMGIPCEVYMDSVYEIMKVNSLGEGDRLLAERAGAKIVTGQEVTKAFAEAYKPDAIIIAAGSSPLRPPIPGLDGENVILVNDQYKHEKPITDSVVVFGGGISGVECAIHMGMEGKTVHLVEMRDDVALDSVIRQRPLLLEKLYKLCTVHTGYRGLEVTKEGIWCQTKEGEKVLVPGTTVICALGQRPRWNVAQELYDCAPWVRVIGDANAVGTITKATYQGHHAALDI